MPKRFVIVCAATKKIKIDGWALRDKGAAHLEMLPCPLGVVEVRTADVIMRYAAVMFYQKKHILLSVQKLKAGDTVSVTGLNLDSGAADLVNLAWRLCQSELAQRTIVIDRKKHDCGRAEGKEFAGHAH